LSDRIYWEFLLFSCCFSPYFLHKKAGWRLGLYRPTFLKVQGPGSGKPHPAKKTPAGHKQLNQFGKIFWHLMRQQQLSIIKK
ncbi:hypothetical protein, partial [Enterobacter intestinihominis]